MGGAASQIMQRGSYTHTWQILTFNRYASMKS
jgi:hypothetical protein